MDYDPGLQERNYGDVRGTAYADLPEDIFGPDYTPPGGESWALFHARVDAAWGRVIEVARRSSPNLAVVTHGLVLQRILAAHLDPPPGHVIDRTAWGNTCVTQIEGPPWRQVRTLACVAHLTGTTAGGTV